MDNYTNLVSEKPEFFTGYLSDIPQQREKTVKVEITLLACRVHNKWTSVEGKLIAYFEKNTASLQLRYGNNIVFKNKLSSIQPPMNPFEFDYKDFLEL